MAAVITGYMPGVRTCQVKPPSLKPIKSCNLFFPSVAIRFSLFLTIAVLLKASLVPRLISSESEPGYEAS